MKAQSMPAAMDAAVPAAAPPVYDKYAAESDLRHLQEAKRIQKDPHRMKHVKRAAKEKLSEMAHLKSLAR